MARARYARSNQDRVPQKSNMLVRLLPNSCSPSRSPSRSPSISTTQCTTTSRFHHVQLHRINIPQQADAHAIENVDGRALPCYRFDNFRQCDSSLYWAFACCCCLDCAIREGPAKCLYTALMWPASASQISTAK